MIAPDQSQGLWCALSLSPSPPFSISVFIASLELRIITATQPVWVYLKILLALCNSSDWTKLNAFFRLVEHQCSRARKGHAREDLIHLLPGRSLSPPHPSQGTKIHRPLVRACWLRHGILVQWAESLLPRFTVAREKSHLKSDPLEREAGMNKAEIYKGGMNMLQSITMWAVNRPCWPERPHTAVISWSADSSQQAGLRWHLVPVLLSKTKLSVLKSLFLQRVTVKRRIAPQGRLQGSILKNPSLNHPRGEWFVDGRREDELNPWRICFEKCLDWMRKN